MGNCRSARVQYDVLERKEGDKTPLGHYIFTIAYGSRDRVKFCIHVAEQERGSPVYMADVHNVWLRHSCRAKVLPIFWPCSAMMDLVFNDEIMANWNFTRFTMKKENQRSDSNDTGYELFSDRIRRVFPQYSLNQQYLTFLPKPDTPTVNFIEFKELMLSKDLSRLAELDWID